MIQGIIDVIVSIVLFMPRLLFSFYVDLAEFLILKIPEIDIVDPSSLASGLSELSYIIGLFEIDYGLTAMLSALAARFLLRRIPGIG